jgi:hypothetical protein
MPTFYRDGEVTVTEAAIVVDGRAFPIAELSFVWHQRGRPTLRTASRRWVRWGLIAVLAAPVVAAAVAVAGLVAGGGGVVARVGVAAALIALGLALLALLVPLVEFPMMALERSYDRGTEVREIWVRWRDQDLVLLRTTDAARFGRIYRAIERAVERHDG